MAQTNKGRSSIPFGNKNRFMDALQQLSGGAKRTPVHEGKMKEMINAKKKTSTSAGSKKKGGYR